MSNKGILLSSAKLAEVTGGYWVNNKDNLIISEVRHKFATPNSLFVIYDSSWPKYKISNEDEIQTAIKKGISAILAKEDSNIKYDIPILVVKDTYKALRKIALQNSKLSHAKRIIVTGSFGKTAFKGQLHHIIKKQYNTYANLDSANRVVPTYCNLASLKEEDELLIIEQPISRDNRTYRRASYVEPDIVVITSIGHEHIDRHHTIQNIVKKKTSMAKALKNGGKVIIPKEDKYYELLKKELEKYENIEILTFGKDSSCNAYILRSQYSDLTWNITANIQGVIVEYMVPFPEIYAPITSLSVLLSVYYLDGDVIKAAREYYSASNYKSSGKFYEVNYKSKKFYLYDQSKRGGIEGYEAFFKTLSYLKPKKNGKKIVLTSEFVDYKDGEMKYIDIKYFQKLIKNAGIDFLYTVEKFQKHNEVINGIETKLKHIDKLDLYADELINSISNDDIFCIKGIYESHLPEFIKYMKKLDNISIKEIKY